MWYMNDNRGGRAAQNLRRDICRLNYSMYQQRARLGKKWIDSGCQAGKGGVALAVAVHWTVWYSVRTSSRLQNAGTNGSRR